MWKRSARLIQWNISFNSASTSCTRWLNCTQRTCSYSFGCFHHPSAREPPRIPSCRVSVFLSLSMSPQSTLILVRVFGRAADVDETVRVRESARCTHTIIFLKIYGSSIVGCATQLNAIYAFLLRQRIVLEYILCNFVTHISIAA